MKFAKTMRKTTLQEIMASQTKDEGGKKGTSKIRPSKNSRTKERKNEGLGPFFFTKKIFLFLRYKLMLWFANSLRLGPLGTHFSLLLNRGPQRGYSWSFRVFLCTFDAERHSKLGLLKTMPEPSLNNSKVTFKKTIRLLFRSWKWWKSSSKKDKNWCSKFYY